MARLPPTTDAIEAIFVGGPLDGQTKLVTRVSGRDRLTCERFLESQSYSYLDTSLKGANHDLESEFRHVRGRDTC